MTNNIKFNEGSIDINRVTTILIYTNDKDEYNEIIQDIIKLINSQGKIIDLTNSSNQKEVYKVHNNIHTYMEEDVELLYTDKYLHNICENTYNTSVLCFKYRNMDNIKSFIISNEENIDIIVFKRANVYKPITSDEAVVAMGRYARRAPLSLMLASNVMISVEKINNKLEVKSVECFNGILNKKNKEINN